MPLTAAVPDTANCCSDSEADGDLFESGSEDEVEDPVLDFIHQSLTRYNDKYDTYFYGKPVLGNHRKPCDSCGQDFGIGEYYFIDGGPYDANKLCADCMAHRIAAMPEDSDGEEDDAPDATLNDSSEGEGTLKASLLARQAAVQAANQAQATRRPFLQEGHAKALELVSGEEQLSPRLGRNAAHYTAKHQAPLFQTQVGRPAAGCTARAAQLFQQKGTRRTQAQKRALSGGPLAPLPKRQC